MPRETEWTTERQRIDALATPLLARAATPYVALSGAANIVMQLSRPEVGYGVKDSPVEEARLFDHPRRRRRTTVGFLAVAVMGTATERAAYRQATNVSHAQVGSAFDAELQQWVGSCIYLAFEDASVAVHGPLGADAEEFYRQGVIFGGMLQMPAARWPSDRPAFEDYWQHALGAVSIDQPVRDYLMAVIRMEYLGERISRRVASRRTWLTTGFLRPQFREAMRLPWTAADQQRFDTFTRRTAATIRRTPTRLRHVPFTGAIKDVRKRLAAGTPLF